MKQKATLRHDSRSVARVASGAPGGFVQTALPECGFSFARLDGEGIGLAILDSFTHLCILYKIDVRNARRPPLTYVFSFYICSI